MRQPVYLKQISATKQQGFALFIVLMIMIVIALLVVAATQSYNTEQRISTNDADRKLATSLAEAALRQGEREIIPLEDGSATFTAECTNGLCQATGAPTGVNGNITVTGSHETEAWLRYCENQRRCLEVNGREFTVGGNISRNPRYIIEYLSTDATSGQTFYRVTAKAWGKNENTQVVLQSYVSNE